MTYRFRNFCLLLVCLACFSFAASTTQAQQADANRNNRPFFGRTALGVGYVSLESDPDQSNLSIDHVGMYWDLAVGAKVWRELSLHGSYFGGWAWEPNIEQNGERLPGQHGSKKSLSIHGLGPGLTYHFLPVNLYLSYAFGCGWSVLDFHRNDAGAVPGWSNFGFANQVMIGKEWFAGRGMAFGAAVQALFAHVKDSDDEAYNSFGGSVMLSATYH